MRYSRHDFARNLLTAAETGDTESARDILLHEIAELILSAPFAVEDALRNSGVSLPKSPSDKALAKAIAENIGTSQALARRMMVLMINNQGAPPMLNSAGNIDWNNVITQGAGVIKSVFGFLGASNAPPQGSGSPPPQGTSNAGLTQAQIMALIAASRNQPQKSNTGLYVGVGIGAALLITGIIITVIKLSKKSKT